MEFSFKLISLNPKLIIFNYFSLIRKTVLLLQASHPKIVFFHTVRLNISKAWNFFG